MFINLLLRMQNDKQENMFRIIREVKIHKWNIGLYYTTKIYQENMIHGEEKIKQKWPLGWLNLHNLVDNYLKTPVINKYVQKTK